MNILGIAFNFHDASACLVRDGRVVAAAEEERFSRLKHDLRFPENAIAYCLSEGRIRPRDLTCIAFYEKPVRKIERVLQVATNFAERSHEMVRHQLSHQLSQGLRLEKLLHEKIGYNGPVHYSPHHLSHAASAFYLSPFEESAVLTIDGVGEWATTAQFSATGKSLTALREIHYPHSLGLFYSTLTAYLGFRVNEDEFQVMGLASYGNPRYRREMDNLLKIFDDGSFALALEYFAFPYDAEQMYAPPLVELLGPPRLPSEPITERHQDIAASLQAATQDAVVNLARSLRERHPSKNLCMAGGVAYNCVANTEVANRSGFQQIWVQPAAGDSGGALGAALASYHMLHAPSAPREPEKYDTRLGPGFDDAAIIEALRQAEVVFEQLSADDLCRQTAEFIHRGLIIGWFQGRMEFGPRALGSRSILANPCDPNMKDTLNLRVKFREEFRPFAPAVIEEAAQEYFDLAFASPFMLFAPRVKPEMAARIPSVTHVDGTARVQTVSRTENPLFHQLIGEFGRLSGVPIVINTSFNVAGEPIVCTPADAVRCFLNTDIDVLAIGHCIVQKG
jgi:carbamoyltransferase